MTVAYRRPSRVSGIESMRGVNNETHWCVLHHKFEIVSVYAGRTEARAAREGSFFRSRFFDVQPNTMNVLVPGDVHETVRRHAPEGFDVLILDPAVVRELLPEHPAPEEIRFAAGVFPISEDFLGLCRSMHALIAEDAEPLALEETAARILRATISIAGEPELRAQVEDERRPDAARVRQVVDYLHSSYAASPDLGQLSSLVQCHRLRLLRSFQRTTGLTPHRYLLQIRVSRARERLSRGVPIARVAVDCGFSDQSHFQRVFKSTVGVTPGEYAAGHPSRVR